MNTEGISARCSAFVAGLKYEDLSPATIASAKNSLVDFLGCTIGGASTTAAGIIYDYLRAVSGPGKSTVIGVKQKTDMLNAAFANGCFSHILETDDVHKTAMIHPAAPVMPAVISLAEAYGLSGREMITSIVAGYEIEGRVGLAVSPSHYEIWHNTATCGTFGSAAAAASLLKLNPCQTNDALGNAGSQAAGLWEFVEDSAMTKYLHCGKAAMNGIIAALLAKRGFTGAKRILEGKRGFFAGYCHEDNFAEHFRDLGARFLIDETTVKPYPSCRHTHAGIDAILWLRQQYHIDYREVTAIWVKTYKTAMKIAGNWRHDTSAMAKFSLPYCLATALKQGGLGIGDFSDQRLADLDIPLLIKKIDIQTPEEIDRQFPDKWPAQVTIVCGEKEYRCEVTYPKGDPENPLNDYELDEKYFDLTALTINKARAQKLLSQCRNLENITSFSLNLL